VQDPQADSLGVFWFQKPDDPQPEGAADRRHERKSHHPRPRYHRSGRAVNGSKKL